MTEPIQNTTLAQATILLGSYGFEMKGYIPQELIDKWLKEYSAKWIRAAIIEALYQGRYKAISVEQILKLWSRRKQMTCHFTHEFERLICRNLLYSVDAANESSRVISQEPKTSERKIHRKSFNPPVLYKTNPILPEETEQQKGENPHRDQTTHQLNPITQEPDLYRLDENSDFFEDDADRLSANYSQEFSLANHLFSQENQLDYNKDDEGLYATDTKVNNPQDLKMTLTNLDELFTHFVSNTDFHRASQSASGADEDEGYQWRGIMARRAIDEFTPQLDRSELYSKLKAVVQQELE